MTEKLMAAHLVSEPTGHSAADRALRAVTLALEHFGFRVSHPGLGWRELGVDSLSTIGILAMAEELMSPPPAPLDSATFPASPADLVSQLAASSA